MNNRAIMTFIAMSIVGSVGAAGCAQKPRDRIQGRWFGEAVENITEAQTARTLGWVKGMAMEFVGSRVTVTLPAESPRSGTFRVLKADDENITLSFQRDDGGTDQADFKIGPENTLYWKLETGQTIVLKKPKS